MIRRERMFEPMLAANPSFRAAWDVFLEEWASEHELPQYLLLADLAQDLITKLDRGETEAFPVIFAVVERWHVEGDDYVREASTIGLLEDLQNLNLHERTKPEQFIPWLEPVSRRYWAKIEAFWNDGVLIRHDDEIIPFAQRSRKGVLE